ncbi:hypothetical protein V8C42DRAFT_349298 [Trichoderma barbatum]
MHPLSILPRLLYAELRAEAENSEILRVSPFFPSPVATMAVSDDNVFHYAKLEGLALGIFATSVVFSVLNTIVMGLRGYIRLRMKCFGMDDWLMTIGWATNLLHYGVAIWGSVVGVGTRNAKLNSAQQQEALKSIVFWQLCYALTLVFIKSSICVALTRITQVRIYLFILRGLIVLSAVMSSVGIIVIFNQCKPFQAYWDKSRGTCMPTIIPTILSYAASVSNVITDTTVAAVPYFILRDTMMRPRLKLYVNFILGLGLTAGIASIIRVPYSNAYDKADDTVYHVGDIVLWTVVETGVGVIAGSLPSLRAFFKHLAKDVSTNEDQNSAGTKLVHIGGRPHPLYGAEIGVTVVANPRDEDSYYEDGESTKNIIKVTKEIVMSHNDSQTSIGERAQKGNSNESSRGWN